jgi:signal transduction histidine kinase
VTEPNCTWRRLPLSSLRLRVRALARWTGTGIVASFLAVGAPAVAAEKAVNVLVIYANSRLLPANVKYDQALRKTIITSKDRPVSIFDEFLDVPRFGEGAYIETTVAYLRAKYQVIPPDVIVVSNDAALGFMLKRREDLFPLAPVVYMSVTGPFLKSIGNLPADFVGVPVEYDFSDTVEQALRWHPNARRLVIVTGTTDWDRQWEARLRTEALRFKDRAPAEFLAGLPTDVLLERLGKLGSDVIVYTPGFFKDGNGRDFTPRESVEAMAGVATAPIYAPFDTFVGTGVVGGRVNNFHAMGEGAGRIINALLDGGTPASLRLPAVMPTTLNVDWRQIRRWGIDESAIPSDAIVQFREQSLLQAHRTEVAIAALVLLVQGGLIIGLLVERQRRHAAERESRARFAEMAHMNRRVALGGLAASIAHELNQPLGAIHNNASAAKMLIKADPPRLDEVREILDDIQQDDMRASAVIAGIRKMLRKTDVDVGELDLNRVIGETTKLLTADAAARGVALEADLAPGLPSVRADRVQVQQVILNLALNAMEAMKEQPADMRRLVVRSVRASAKEAEVSVVDSGVGIPAELLPRIFMPFVTSRSGGMGVGLSISRTIVEAHGGRLRAENLPAGGAAFHFTLPFAAVQQA